MSQPTRANSNSSLGRLLTDLGPTLVFMVAYNVAQRKAPEGEAIYWATGVFVVATLAALANAVFREKRVPPMLIVTAAIVTVFGALTLWLHNAFFAYIKPTIINLCFAAAIFGGLLFRQNVMKILFGPAFELPDRIWRIFALRWGAFFVFLAGLNEVVWRMSIANHNEAFWVNFKLLGVIPITFLFMLANLPLITKHQIQPPAEPEAKTGP